MKITALTIALLLGGTALAQTDSAAGSMAYDGDGAVTAAYETDGITTEPTMATDATSVTASTGAVVTPSNANPERDARGIAVLSDPATVPAGWNGTPAGDAMGGPELDPVTGEPVAADTYPACTATVTDNCLQTYEKGRKAS
jgi:hypothetical protein